MKSGKKILIAYFTATNSTKKVAEQMQKILNCDIYQIEPEQKYTSNDLNWNDEKSRSTIEQKEQNQRPKIKKNKNPNIENYDIILIGFPVWWYKAPVIINTFLESYDFSGKDIIVWGTSWESDFEKTMENLEGSCKGKLIKGKIFNKDQRKKDDIMKFVESI